MTIGRTLAKRGIRPAAVGFVGASAVSTILSNFPAAQAKRAVNQRAVIGVAGDSLTAGTGTATTGFRDNSTVHQTAALLNAAGILTRADAWFPSGNVASSTKSVAGAGWNISTSFFSLGGGAENAGSSGTAMVFTPDIAADRFDVLVFGYSGGGAFTISDSSGTLYTGSQNVIPAAGATSTSFSNGTQAIRRVTASRAVASTLPISVVGTSCFFVGIIPYDTTAPCLELWNMGWPGSTANADWRATAQGWNAYNAFAALALDGSIVHLGANDSNTGVTAANFETALTAIVTRLQGLSVNTVLAKTHKGISTGSGYNFSAAYLAAIDNVTTAKGLKSPIDYNALTIPDTEYADTIHLLTAGYGREATVLKNYLTA